MMEIGRRAGMPIHDEATLASALERHITSCRDMTRVEQALRTVIVASPEAVTVGQPSAPIPAPAAATAVQA